MAESTRTLKNRGFCFPKKICDCFSLRSEIRQLSCSLFFRISSWSGSIFWRSLKWSCISMTCSTGSLQRYKSSKKETTQRFSFSNFSSIHSSIQRFSTSKTTWCERMPLKGGFWPRVSRRSTITIIWGSQRSNKMPQKG